jgi:hypothetical protein
MYNIKLQPILYFPFYSFISKRKVKRNEKAFFPWKKLDFTFNVCIFPVRQDSI